MPPYQPLLLKQSTPYILIQKRPSGNTFFKIFCHFPIKITGFSPSRPIVPSTGPPGTKREAEPAPPLAAAAKRNTQEPIPRRSHSRRPDAPPRQGLPRALWVLPSHRCGVVLLYSYLIALLRHATLSIPQFLFTIPQISKIYKIIF